MRNAFVFGLAAALLVCMAGVGQAVDLVNENFDSMGATGTSLPAGWTVGYLGASGLDRVSMGPPYGADGQSLTALTPIYPLGAIGVDFRTVYNGGTFSDIQHVFNCGLVAGTDRAIGNYPRSVGTNGKGDHVTQVAFTNTTGAEISSIHLEYDMEQWSLAQGTAPQPPGELLRVLLSSTSDISGFNYMGAAFDGVAPNQGANAIQVVDGNLAANKVHVSGDYALLTPVPAGGSMWLRFHDWNESGTTDNILAVDNVRVTAEAVPEPSTIALLLAGGLGLALASRRRK